MPHTKTHDPSQTSTLRLKFAQNLRAKFSKLNIDIIKSIVQNDVFNLKSSPVFNPQTLQVNQPIPPGGLTGTTDTERLTEFQAWLQLQINAGILEISTVAGIDIAGTALTQLDIAAPGQFMNTFITSAFNRGRDRALAELNKAGVITETEIGVISTAFEQGVPANRIAQLQQQAFNELKGVTDAMAQQISRELSLGLINGDSPRTIAKAITNRVNTIGKTRATLIARTEIIRAHHLGNIDTLEAAGVEGVTVLAEWVTAGDDRVCPNCDALQGKIFTLKEIRGLIPLHPQCRCVAVPAGVGEKVKGNPSREIEDILTEDIVKTDKGVQDILNDEVPEEQRIDIVNNSSISNVVKDILQAVKDGVNETRKLATNSFEIPAPKAKDGEDGKPGIAGYAAPKATDGEDGDPGTKGVGISFIENVGKDILFHMTNGKGYRLIDVIPEDGEDAIGLKNIVCNESNEVIVELTDGTLQIIGRFEDGDPGKDGVGVEHAFVHNQNLFIKLTDGEVIDTGEILNPEEVVEQLKEFLDPISVVDADINDLGMLILELSNGDKINAGRARAKTPDHQIDNQLNRLRFRKPSGQWGKWIDVGRRRRGGGGIGEAPIDGKQYARKDAAWVIITGGGGTWGGITGDIKDQTDLFSYIEPLKNVVYVDSTLSDDVEALRFQTYDLAADYIQDNFTPSYFNRWAVIGGGSNAFTTLRPWIYPMGREGQTWINSPGYITDDNIENHGLGYQLFNVSLGGIDPNKTIVATDCILNDQLTTVNSGSLLLYSSTMFALSSTPNLSTINLQLLEGTVAEVGNTGDLWLWGDSYVTLLGSSSSYFSFANGGGAQAYLTQDFAISRMELFGGQMYGFTNTITLDGNVTHIAEDARLSAAPIIIDDVNSVLVTRGFIGDETLPDITVTNGEWKSNDFGIPNEDQVDTTDRQTTVQSPNWDTYREFTLAYTPVGRYRIDFEWSWNIDVTNRDALFRILVNGSPLTTLPISVESKDPASNFIENFFAKVDLPAGDTNTVELQFAIESGPAGPTLTVNGFIIDVTKKGN